MQATITSPSRWGDCFPCRDHELINVYVDDKQVATNESHQPGEGRDANMPSFTVHFIDSNAHRLRVEYTHRQGMFGAGLTLKLAATR